MHLLYLLISPIVSWFIVIVYAAIIKAEGNVFIEFLWILSAIVLVIMGRWLRDLWKTYRKTREIN